MNRLQIVPVPYRDTFVIFDPKTEMCVGKPNIEFATEFNTMDEATLALPFVCYVDGYPTF